MTLSSMPGLANDSTEREGSIERPSSCSEVRCEHPQTTAERRIRERGNARKQSTDLDRETERNGKQAGPMKSRLTRCPVPSLFLLVLLQGCQVEREEESPLMAS